MLLIVSSWSIGSLKPIRKTSVTVWTSFRRISQLDGESTSLFHDWLLTTVEDDGAKFSRSRFCCSVSWRSVWCQWSSRKSIGLYRISQRTHQFRSTHSMAVNVCPFGTESIVEIDLRSDFIKFHQANAFCFSRYPYILDAATKSNLLQMDASLQMRDQYDEVMPIHCPDSTIHRLLLSGCNAVHFSAIYSRPLSFSSHSGSCGYICWFSFY